MYEPTTKSTESIKPNILNIKEKSKLVLKCCRGKLWKGEKCRCEEIKTIQKYIRLWYTKINKLEPIAYRDDKITYRCINVFTDKNRSKNDGNNKKRENIVGCIINNNIPKGYYRCSSRWYNLKKTIDLFIKKLCEMKGIPYIVNVVCIHKAGRGHHYDFKLHRPIFKMKQDN